MHDFDGYQRTIIVQTRVSPQLNSIRPNQLSQRNNYN